MGFEIQTVHRSRCLHRFSVPSQIPCFAEISILPPFFDPCIFVFLDISMKVSKESLKKMKDCWNPPWRRSQYYEREVYNPPPSSNKWELSPPFLAFSLPILAVRWDFSGFSATWMRFMGTLKRGIGVRGGLGLALGFLRLH